MATREDPGTKTRALHGASVLILLQLVSRAVTFVANQVLLRFLTAQLLGVSTQLEVYYLSVIFFARESLRVAVQRQDSLDFPAGNSKNRLKKNGNQSTQAVVNLGYLAIALGVPLSFLLGYLYLSSVSASTLATAPNLAVSLYIYGLAAITELLSEPAFVVMQNRLQFGTRAAAESIATFLRCVVTLGSAVWGSDRDFGVLPFALGQLSYGAGLLAVYAWHGAGLAKRESFSLFLRPIPDLPPKTSREEKQGSTMFIMSYFYQPAIQLASSMMTQSVVKHILTQGDTFLVSVLSTPTAQGVYALANNYGGLLARLVFQPVEESSRSYFSRILAPSTSTTGTAMITTETHGPADNLEPKSRPEVTLAQEANATLQSLLKSYLLLSLAITTLGPTAASPLLSLVAGPRWADSDAPACLAAYMWYIPLLALNGVAEAFVASVATGAEVHRQSAWMGVFTLVFGAAGFILLRVLEWGAIGLVVANGINMACRIVWCGVFIRRHFAQKGVGFELLGVLPSAGSMLAGAVASQLVKQIVASGAQGNAKAALIELVKLTAVAVPFVVAVAFFERKFIFATYQAIRGRGKSIS
ncbi:Rft protein-domain-containing protein [Dichotomopilus funicola]|uniref:Man(5)GlcNAc(2)-PP-dolichol translocation protein RFT1 n=1 Tax=Dichotomopilus funicola TaxID=1934379 RepID=A0AAN6V1K9_9PEZI|nr:Rft protein-domain-containing protein [Dichotomopilus funicola]